MTVSCHKPISKYTVQSPRAESVRANNVIKVTYTGCHVQSHGMRQVMRQVAHFLLPSKTSSWWKHPCCCNKSTDKLITQYLQTHSSTRRWDPRGYMIHQVANTLVITSILSKMNKSNLQTSNPMQPQCRKCVLHVSKS